MDWYLCKCFGKLKEYTQTKKQNRNNLRKARFFYLQKLFKKSFESLKALELQPYKRYWFNKLKEHHFTIRNKEELIKTGHDRLIMKESFVSWFMLQKENENYNYLIHSMLQFYTLRLKARALKAFEYNQYFNIKLREHDYTRKLNKKRKSFLLWKAFCGHQKLKKLDKGRAYEYYYFSLLKKGFYQWMPSCRKIREEAEMAKLKKKFFNLWKKLYQSNETAKTKAVTTLRRQILKKVTLKLWKMHTWFEKRTKIARSFFLYRRFMGWKLAVSKMAYSKEQKQKANVWYKWKIERKYFEKFCVNHKKESRTSKEYKIKVYQFQKKSGRALLDRYFRALKQALMIRHVEIVRNDKLLTTFFSRWARMTYQNKLKRQKKRGYTKRMRMAKLFTSFETLKTNWLVYKRKELIAKNFHHFWKLRKTFKIWMAIKIYEERHRELRADHQYCLRLLQNGFYGLHSFNQSRKQRLKFEEKLDWYIEKKIRILLKKILRKLHIWAKANIKYREHNTAFLYHVFYNFKLNCKLNRLT